MLDPFAGGSVRGIVAHKLGRDYTGVELRPEQVEANKAQGKEICGDDMPQWICGDSKNIDVLAGGEYDFLLTCPPYGDLEKYSDDPDDLSNMSKEDFTEAYKTIFKKAIGMLKEDTFAAVVVGNYRDKQGYLEDLAGLTVRAVEEAGARYYNDLIYMTPNGTMPVRAGGYFKGSRKIARGHQYVLIFAKGDPKRAAERLGDVDIPDLEGEDEGRRVAGDTN